MEVHKDYPCHVDNYQRGRAQPVSLLVIHYVGATGGAEANARYYGRTPGIGASAHYFVDHAPNAEVWASVPEEDTAWHCGAKSYRHPTCRNSNSIGIEMCCHLDAKGGWYIDEATMAAAAELGRDIMTRYGIPLENVLRHYDVTGKLCPRPLIDEDKWTAFKARLEDDMVSYKTIEDVPASYRPSVQKLMDRGALKGYENGAIYVSEDLCRTITILDRLGLLDGR
ncbi:peptidoglycan recognition protein family protein [Intestinimonas butyriciproducens]|mgnify:CR=1 FL=1|uniref:peptidoglycan recognition protein family protein n=1 Tax=Intestinimonas butyriciproducens TaxID=1297617 RepID=UPI001959DDD2|nr:N-acetylmuramoyl-L-alanine amidase [Intestinimonas butyriciproducens]MBM6976696.1 N-acetylmuramoyl-L-alanine amidase [Intestinimonas butyriciproducens]